MVAAVRPPKARVFPEQKWEPVGPYSIIMHYMDVSENRGVSPKMDGF